MKASEFKTKIDESRLFGTQMTGQLGMFLFCIFLMAYLVCLGINISEPLNPRLEIQKKTLMNVNTATWSELLQIPGITETVAWNIVKHRELNGEYSSVDQLSNIKGIGKKSLEKIKSYVALNSAKSLAIEKAAEAKIALLEKPKKNLNLKLDPNTATISELQALPGIGLKLANNIINKRENMVFLNAADLLKVPGIGKKTFEKVAPFIEIQNEKK
ncbi:MAG: ComEA family DNA-binding protein [Gemmataceae bacterium]